MNKRFWNWGDAQELYLYGTIAEESWADDDVTPELFREELMKETGPITVWISSPGGDTVAASRIYSMLMDYPHPVTVKIDGIAASAASVIAMAGSSVLMAPTALMLIHDPMTVAMGNEHDMEKAIDVLSAVKDSILDAYELKTGLDRKTLARMMSEETWMDAKKAVELGFADGILSRDERPADEGHKPTLFSQKKVDAILMDRLRGIPVDPLYQRLEDLR